MGRPSTFDLIQPRINHTSGRAFLARCCRKLNRLADRPASSPPERYGSRNGLTALAGPQELKRAIPPAMSAPSKQNWDIFFERRRVRIVWIRRSFRRAD